MNKGAIPPGAHIALAEALQSQPVPPNLAVHLADIGSLELEFYSPHLMDLQQPHSRDELYVIAKGTGILEVEGEQLPFAAGDVLAVPAGADHRFTTFSDDFGTWVMFYGPEGGERNAS